MACTSHANERVVRVCSYHQLSLLPECSLDVLSLVLSSMYVAWLSKPRAYTAKQLITNCQQGHSFMGTLARATTTQQVTMPSTLNILPTPHILHAFPRRRRHTSCGRDAHRALFSCTAITLVPARLGCQSIVLFHPSTHPPHPASPCRSILARSAGSLVFCVQGGHVRYNTSGRHGVRFERVVLVSSNGTADMEVSSAWSYNM